MANKGSGSNQSGSNQSGSLWGAVLLGSALGAVTGLLLAPKSGRETRRILRRSADALPELAEELSVTIQNQADRLSETALRNWDGTLERLKEAIAAGVEAGQLETLRNQRGTPSKSAYPGDEAETVELSMEEGRRE
jgi:gas vesicle protein